MRAKCLWLGVVLAAAIMVSGCTSSPHPGTPSNEPTKEQAYAAKEKFWEGISDYSGTSWYEETATKGLNLVGEHFTDAIYNPIKVLHPSKNDFAQLATGALVVSLNDIKLADLQSQLVDAVKWCDKEPAKDLTMTKLQEVTNGIAKDFAQQKEPLAADLESARTLADCYQNHVSDQRLKGVFALAQVEAQTELKEGASGISGQFVAGQDPALADAEKVLNQIVNAPMGDRFCEQYPWWWDNQSRFGKCVIGGYIKATPQGLQVDKEAMKGLPIDTFRRTNSAGDEDLNGDGIADYHNFGRVIGFDIPQGGPNSLKLLVRTEENTNIPSLNTVDFVY